MCANAKDLGPNLALVGFVAQLGTSGFNLKGDVAVIDGFSKGDNKLIAKSHPYGHAAMFDGTQWISDFKQTGASPYPGSDYRLAKPAIVIYRHA